MHETILSTSSSEFSASNAVPSTLIIRSDSGGLIRGHVLNPSHLVSVAPIFSSDEWDITQACSHRRMAHLAFVFDLFVQRRWRPFYEARGPRPREDWVLLRTTASAIAQRSAPRPGFEWVPFRLRVVCTTIDLWNLLPGYPSTRPGSF